MAFQLTSFRAISVIPDSKTRVRQLVHLQFEVTRGASGDVTMDLDTATTSGTFFGAVTADATYGAVGTVAMTYMAGLLPVIERLVSCELTASNGFMARVASGPTATQYALTNQGTFPVVNPRITFASNAAPATVYVHMCVALQPGTTMPDVEVGA